MTKSQRQKQKKKKSEENIRNTRVRLQLKSRRLAQMKAVQNRVDFNVNFIDLS